MTPQQLLKYLACPDCQHQHLKLQKNTFNCPHCHRNYPIKNNIPILLPYRLSHQEKSQTQIFDRHYRYHHQRHLWQTSMVRRLFNHPFIKKGQIYLDIGCGPSAYTLVAASQKGLISIGIDISNAAATHAQNRLKKYPKTAIVVASASHLPFKKNCFHYISAISVLEHLKNHRSVINQITRLLKKSGHLFLVVPNSYQLIPAIFRLPKKYLDHQVGHLRSYSIDQLKKICHPLVLQKHFYNGHYIKIIQIILHRLKLISLKKWWQIETRDVNSNPSGLQLNAFFVKKC